jgi:trk system potassium uptake protein
MNIRLLVHVLGGMLLFLAATLLAPIPFSLAFGDGQILTFLFSALITGGIGAGLYAGFATRAEFTLREGFAIVTFTWLAYALFGALPYLISGSLPNPVDAVFESISGFTTTGASVYTDIEAQPKSILFWRALTQWLGGMGIIVLTVAILPLLGVGGMQLYEAESAGPTADRLTPRIQDTARVLWGVYALFTVVGIVLLMLVDMSFYDAVCHALAAIATGGFSTRNASMGAFGVYSQWVIILLMLAGSINFSLHYFALRGQWWKYWESSELRLYVGLWILAVAIIFVVNWSSAREAVAAGQEDRPVARYVDPLVNFQDSTFSVMSIMSTTGFATADFEQWHIFPQTILFLAMFFGGCGGSTAGGLKQSRLLLLLEHAWLQIEQLIHPRQVLVLKLDRRPVSPEVMRDILGFTVLYVGVFFIAFLLLTVVGVDLVTAATAAISALGSIGPGLNLVGPMDNYFHMHWFAKLVLSATMLLGRLEISTVLVLFFYSTWKR